MDISQSSTLVKFIEKKEFEMAYKLACLGVPENDLRFLGIEAFQHQNFEIAEKCFVKLKDIPFIELTKKYVEMGKNAKNLNPDVLKAEIYAYQNKYQEASSAFIKAGKTDEAIKLYCDLKRFDEAVRVLRMGGGGT